MEEQKKIKPVYDGMLGLYISINGEQCATSGGITGIGYGLCSGALLNKGNVKKYKINIKLNP